MFIEMYYLFSSFWHYQYYYVFGFLALIFVNVLLVCACLSVMIVYIHLNMEDHQVSQSACAPMLFCGRRVTFTRAHTRALSLSPSHFPVRDSGGGWRFWRPRRRVSTCLGTAHARALPVRVLSYTDRMAGAAIPSTTTRT